MLEIDARATAGQSRYVVRELSMALWRREHWPMQAMGYSQWDELADLLSACAAGAEKPPAKKMFPGPVLVEPVAGRLRLTLLER